MSSSNPNTTTMDSEGTSIIDNADDDDNTKDDRPHDTCNTKEGRSKDTETETKSNSNNDDDEKTKIATTTTTTTTITMTLENKNNTKSDRKNVTFLEPNSMNPEKNKKDDNLDTNDNDNYNNNTTPPNQNHAAARDGGGGDGDGDGGDDGIKDNIHDDDVNVENGDDVNDDDVDVDDDNDDDNDNDDTEYKRMIQELGLMASGSRGGRGVGGIQSGEPQRPSILTTTMTKTKTIGDDDIDKNDNNDNDHLLQHHHPPSYYDASSDSNHSVLYSPSKLPTTTTTITSPIIPPNYHRQQQQQQFLDDDDDDMDDLDFILNDDDDNDDDYNDGDYEHHHGDDRAKYDDHDNLVGNNNINDDDDDEFWLMEALEYVKGGGGGGVGNDEVTTAAATTTTTTRRKRRRTKIAVEDSMTTATGTAVHPSLLSSSLSSLSSSPTRYGNHPDGLDATAAATTATGRDKNNHNDRRSMISRGSEGGDFCDDTTKKKFNDDDDQDEDDDDDDDDNDAASFFVGDIEAELGDLLNEDLDSAIHRLVGESGVLPPLERAGLGGGIDFDLLPILGSNSNNDTTKAATTNGMIVDAAAAAAVVQGRTTNIGSSAFGTSGAFVIDSKNVVTAASLAAAAAAASAAITTSTNQQEGLSFYPAHDLYSADGSVRDGKTEDYLSPEAIAAKEKEVREQEEMKARELAAARERERKVKEQEEANAQVDMYQMLLRQHYQLLIQQSVLCVRASSHRTGDGKHQSKLISKSNSSPTTKTSQVTKEGGCVNGSTTRERSDTDATVGSRAIRGGDNDNDGNGDDDDDDDDRDFFVGHINPEEVALGLDAAVSMLQDLDMNRRDAIRKAAIYDIRSASHLMNHTDHEECDDSDDHDHSQGHKSNDAPDHERAGGRESSCGQKDPTIVTNEVFENTKTKTLEENYETATKQQHLDDPNRRLTRAAFERLQAQLGSTRHTAFDVPGLWNVSELFKMLDDGRNFHEDTAHKTMFTNTDQHEATRNDSIVCVTTNREACRKVLKDSGAECDDELLPKPSALLSNFTDADEVIDELDLRDVSEPEKDALHSHQRMCLMKNRNIFTAGEDNLLLKGINLFGEKNWTLIEERYLPDRSPNVISQRFSKLCYFIFLAHGIAIDKKGNFATPPKYVSVDQIDEKKAADLKPVKLPQIVNVHRWSLEEDLTLVKAVPIFGNLWAEISARFLPHRDRGHCRKRYQVLERRIKATVSRIEKQKGVREAKRAKEERRKKKKEGIGKSKAAKAVAGNSATPAAKTAKSSPPSKTTTPKSPPKHVSACTPSSPAMKRLTPQANKNNQEKRASTTVNPSQKAASVSPKAEKNQNVVTRRSEPKSSPASKKRKPSPSRKRQSPLRKPTKKMKASEGFSSPRNTKKSAVTTKMDEEIMTVENAAVSLALMNQEVRPLHQPSKLQERQSASKAKCDISPSTLPSKNHLGTGSVATDAASLSHEHDRTGLGRSTAALKTVGATEKTSQGMTIHRKDEPHDTAVTRFTVDPESLHRHYSSYPTTVAYDHPVGVAKAPNITAPRTSPTFHYSPGENGHYETPHGPPATIHGTKSSPHKTKKASTSHTSVENESSSFAATPAGFSNLPGWSYGKNEVLGRGENQSRFAVERILEGGRVEGLSQLTFSKSAIDKETSTRLTIDPYDAGKPNGKRRFEEVGLNDGTRVSSTAVAGPQSSKMRKPSIFDRVVNSTKSPSMNVKNLQKEYIATGVSTAHLAPKEVSEEKKDGTPIKEGPTGSLAGALFSTSDTPLRVDGAFSALGADSNLTANSSSLLRGASLEDSISGTFGSHKMEDSYIDGGPLPLSEASRHERELGQTEALKRVIAAHASPSKYSRSKSRFTHTSAEDLDDAIKGLEALSNSPFKLPSTSTPVEKESSPDEGSVVAEGKASKSLFAQVVGCNDSASRVNGMPSNQKGSPKKRLF